jgi:hypothetical protein
MTKSGRQSKASSLICGGVALAVACDFSGDRSLGTVAEAAGGVDVTTGISVAAPSGGASRTSTTTVGAAGTTAVTQNQPQSCRHTRPADECEDGEFCSLGSDCGEGDEPHLGSCRSQPTDCAASNGYEVVCGCDGQLHDSRCLAELDGISVSELSRCHQACLSDSDCLPLAFSCVELTDGSYKGAICADGICVCGGTTVCL